jgi:hypothetical protein
MEGLMATFSTLPGVVNFNHYAGDTLTFQVRMDTSAIAGRVWSGQVRRTGASAAVDAVLLITPPTVTDGPAQVTLTAADSARLAASMSGTTMKYTGVYDVQLGPAGGGDPVTTVARGTITISADVTRIS